jgi:hypothetical protein
MSDEEWSAAWDELSREITEAWQGEPDAVKAVAEQRR